MKGAMKLIACVCAAAVAMAAFPVAAQQEKPGVNVTIYNGNFAVIKDRRMMEIPKGVGMVRFTDVAATIEATSVNFLSLTDPKAVVQEQNYEFDLVSADKLLRKYIDKKISIFTKDGKIHEGFLMSYDGAQIVVAEDPVKGPIHMVERGDNIKKILFSELPGGLLTRPTLIWEVNSPVGGQQLCKVTYVANNMNWRADYSLVVDKDDKLVDLSGWVTINNGTGATYTDAAIKLLAGDTGGSAAMRGGNLGWGWQYYKGLSKLVPTGQVGREVGKAFAEYYLYKLPQPSTINNSQIKQIELLNAAKVPVKKIFLYDGSQMNWNIGGRYMDKVFGAENKKVNVLLEVENRAERQMGFSLPAGKVRVYKKDDDGSLEFIGEDAIDHTPRDEKMTLYIGDAFDVTGERTQTYFRQLSDRVVEETFVIKVKNHKETAVAVNVIEKFCRGGKIEITETTHKFDMLDARTGETIVDIPKDGEVVIKYTVKYSW